MIVPVDMARITRAIDSLGHGFDVESFVQAAQQWTDQQGVHYVFNVMLLALQLQYGGFSLPPEGVLLNHPESMLPPNIEYLCIA